MKILNLSWNDGAAQNEDFYVVEMRTHQKKDVIAIQMLDKTWEENIDTGNKYYYITFGYLTEAKLTELIAFINNGSKQIETYDGATINKDVVIANATFKYPKSNGFKLTLIEKAAY